MQNKEDKLVGKKNKNIMILVVCWRLIILKSREGILTLSNTITHDFKM